MLKTAKTFALSAFRAVGGFALVRGSAWRGQRLAILCYHGVALDDEHLWNPWLYMSPESFVRRMESLKRHGHAVLALDDALLHMAAGSLPERSVVITFDDGMHDFAERALPVLRQFGFPVTVYVATQAIEFGLPSFPLLCSYVLWKAGDVTVNLELFGGTGSIRLIDESSRNRALRSVLQAAKRDGLSVPERFDFARRIAGTLGVDIGPVIDRRMLTVMSAAEITAASAAGIDFQMHTHSHHSYRDETRYRDEIRINRERIVTMTGKVPEHFCYPSGIHQPDFSRWLAAEHVRSAVTCVPGYAMNTTDSYVLPRVLDHERLSEVEFEAWTSGAARWIPSRASAAPVPEQLGLILKPAGTARE